MIVLHIDEFSKTTACPMHTSHIQPEMDSYSANCIIDIQLVWL